MSFFTSLSGTEKSSARVADGRLILSLPDAETPVIWVMDLDEASTAIIRLEGDKQGNSILKKYGSKGAAETVAVYRDRRYASRALVQASKALEKARGSRVRVGPNAQPVIIRPASKITTIFTGFLYIWFAFFLLSNLASYITAKSSALGTTTINNQADIAANPDGSDMDATGVPLPANDFLKKNGPATTPQAR